MKYTARANMLVKLKAMQIQSHYEKVMVICSGTTCNNEQWWSQWL